LLRFQTRLLKNTNYNIKNITLWKRAQEVYLH
jgi:hypothetical protein